MYSTQLDHDNFRMLTPPLLSFIPPYIAEFLPSYCRTVQGLVYCVSSFLSLLALEVSKSAS